jgi:biopolymer transport protein ExbD
MRLKGAKQVHYDSGPNMTPLVDVVMVILIFLMLAGKFGSNEHYLESKVPIRQGGSGNDKDPVPDETDFRITVDPLEDRFNARPDEMEPCQTPESLKAELTAKLDQLAAGGVSLDKVQVIISPSTSVKYVYLMQVYETALDAEGSGHQKFTKVAFEQPH